MHNKLFCCAILPPAMLAIGLLCGLTANAATNAPGSSEPAASGAKPAASSKSVDHLKMARRIDELLLERWADDDVTPADPASDAEFLRRASLDFTGVIPRASEVRDFSADQQPDKRRELIERLLASPRYATHMATTWRNRILPMGPEQERIRDAMALQKWLRTRFARNLRYDNLVGGLLLATSEDELGPALYFQANNVAPDKMAASAAELFLGLQLQCAQCHDHPFSDWSQKDFWGLAAFFARTKPPADRMGMGMYNQYRVVDADQGDVMLPDTDEIVPPQYPRGDAASDDEYQSRRQQLVVWMTSRDNKYFSRAAANWAWSHLFGRGLVESLDDVHDEDTEASTQLLDELADYFVKSGFDLQALWRALASTQSYQLSSRHADPKSAPPEMFARMLPKPLTPEQLYDSLALLSPPNRVPEYAVALRPGEMARSLDEDPERIEFVRRMRTPPGAATDYRAGTLQALMLMNGRFTDQVTGQSSSRLLGALDAPLMTEDEQIDALFMAALSRPPDADERTACVEALKQATDGAERNRVRSDILWALVQSTEFAFNH